MLTCHDYTMAFTTADARDHYFAGCETKRIRPEPGTALRHVLATNLGIWGSVDSLRRDCADIMRWELEAWAERTHTQALRLPAEAIAANRLFQQAFAACAQVNADQIDALVSSMGSHHRTAPVAQPPTHYLSEDFTRALYLSLARHRDAYHDLIGRQWEERRAAGFE